MNPQQFLSLLDISKRNGTDAAVGLVEEVVTYAPELERIMGRPIRGTWYTARTRPLLATGGVFRKGNQGVVPSASVYDQRRFDCYAFDSQMQIDEMVARAAEQDGDSLALLQAEEAESALRNKAIYIGKQFYGGTANDPQGFPGLLNFFDAFATVVDQRTGAGIDLAVTAGGSSSTCEIVWYIWMHQQGVHFLWGGNQGIDIKPWQLQYVQDQNDPTKRLQAWVTNLSGFIGASAAHPFSIGMVNNVDNTISGGNYAHPYTDKLDLQLMSKFPVGMQPNLVLMSRASRAGLQQSRTVTLFGQMTDPTGRNSGAAGFVAPLPTMTASGIPIVVTDSILTGVNFNTVAGD